MYSETFVLLPVSDGYTNVSITNDQVFQPNLPKLISLEENQQIQIEESRTQQTLATLEGIARRGTSSGSNSYVELRELLATLTSDKNGTHQLNWIHVLIASNIILWLIVLVSYDWTRSFLVRVYQVLVRPTNHHSSPNTKLETVTMSPVTTADLEVADCPHCSRSSVDPMGRTTPNAEVSRQTKGEAIGPPISVEQPNSVERIRYAQPGKFQLQSKREKERETTCQ
jgi:hypothetical protein